MREKEINASFVVTPCSAKMTAPVPGKCLVKMEMHWLMELGAVCSFEASIDGFGMCLPRTKGGHCFQFPK